MATTMEERSFFNRMVSGTDALVQRWLPDPFVIVLVITVLVFLAGMLFEGQGPVAMAEHWGEGFWSLLAFTVQMMMVLVTGYVLASTPLFRRILVGLAGLASTPTQAIVLVSVVALAASWVNWGFGLVIGAIFARSLGRKVPDVDYRVLIAAAYSGFVIWHAGFSGSIPLTAATEGNFLAEKIGIIPTSETIFAPFNLILVALVALVVPVVNVMSLRHGGRVLRAGEVDLAVKDETDEGEDGPSSPAEWLENAMIVSILAAVIGLGYAALYFIENGFQLNLNIVNLVFLFAGLLLHGTPKRFLASVNDAIKGASGILIQFPFYAGIMGMMSGSGMAADLTSFFVEISNATLLPLFAFLSAGFVNVLVPSGGGQWAVQGPIMMDAAKELGADQARVAMAVAWGDAWTNLIQPFWALPALAIAGLGARDIMGFCLIQLFIIGAIVGIGLVVLP